MTTAPPIADAWERRADDLTAWALAHLVSRDDVRGGYWRDAAGGVIRTTRKNTDRFWIPQPQAIRQHFCATRPEHVVGLHTTGCDNTSRFGAIDIDAHDAGVDPAANLQCAIEIVRRLDRHGFTGHAFDSDGRGGVHVWIVFAEPAPTHRVRALLQAMLVGLPQHECFPKQAGLSARNPFGNWIRIPGRHHSREHWSRVWLEDHWAENADATIRYILAIEGDAIDGLPDVPAPVAADNAEPLIGDADDAELQELLAGPAGQWTAEAFERIDNGAKARHDVAWWLACQLRDSRTPRNHAEKLVRLFAETMQRQHPKDRDFTDDEAVSIVHYAYGVAPREPAGKPRPKPQPLSDLRPTLPRRRQTA